MLKSVSLKLSQLRFAYFETKQAFLRNFHANITIKNSITRICNSFFAFFLHFSFFFGLSVNGQ